MCSCFIFLRIFLDVFPAVNYLYILLCTMLFNKYMCLTGVRGQQELACFAAVIMTTWGHLVPLMCKHGLPQLQYLLTKYRYEAVIFALHLIVPLFVNSQELLINNECFDNILYGLVTADRTYTNMVKSSFLVTHNTVLEQFGNMIENHIVSYAQYGLGSPKLLVRLWINSLVSLPNWNKDSGILYLLDVILRAAFFHSDAFEDAHSIFRELLKVMLFMF